MTGPRHDFLAQYPRSLQPPTQHPRACVTLVRAAAGRLRAPAAALRWQQPRLRSPHNKTAGELAATPLLRPPLQATLMLHCCIDDAPATQLYSIAAPVML